MSRCASHFSCDYFHLPTHWELFLLEWKYGICRNIFLHFIANTFVMIVSFLLFFIPLSSLVYWCRCYFFFPLLSWFHGDLSRHAAEALLLSNGTDGSYLLRNSNAGLGCFALSVRLADNKTYPQICDYAATWPTSLLTRQPFCNVWTFSPHQGKTFLGCS